MLRNLPTSWGVVRAALVRGLREGGIGQGRRGLLEREGHPSGCFLRAGFQTGDFLKAEAPLVASARPSAGLTWWINAAVLTPHARAAPGMGGGPLPGPGLTPKPLHGRGCEGRAQASARTAPCDPVRHGVASSRGGGGAGGGSGLAPQRAGPAAAHGQPGRLGAPRERRARRGRERGSEETTGRESREGEAKEGEKEGKSRSGARRKRKRGGREAGATTGEGGCGAGGRGGSEGRPGRGGRGRRERAGRSEKDRQGRGGKRRGGEGSRRER